MKIEDEIKSAFRNNKQKVLVNLHYTFLNISNKLNAVLKPFDLSMQQFNVLRILRGQSPKAVSIGLIRERMLDKNSDVSRILDRLEKKGFVNRTNCKQDKRQKDVLLTKLGNEILAKVDNAESNFDVIVNSLTDDEAQTLSNLLDKVRSGNT